MPLPANGEISLNQIHLEAGGVSSTTCSLNDTDIRELVDKAPEEISRFSDFYGTQREFRITISSTLVDLDLRQFALDNGWDGQEPAYITIPSGIAIRGSVDNNSTAALTISGSWPGGVTLINNGIIEGRGGAGGTGGIQGANGNAGRAGGRALRATTACFVQNTGIIRGGGGGGGGGGGSDRESTCDGGETNENMHAGGGGGGGGRSHPSYNAPGGQAGVASGTGVNLVTVNGNSGGLGNAGAPGPGGAGGAALGLNCGDTAIGGQGGSGGDYGTPGTAGTGGSGTGDLGTNGSGGAGGAAGEAVSGGSFINWLAFGSRIGPVSA